MLRRFSLFTTLLLTPFAALHAADSPSPTIDASKSLPERVDVLVGGQQGYHAYRIPSLIVASNGDLLLFCEARKVSLEDDGDIDLVQLVTGEAAAEPDLEILLPEGRVPWAGVSGSRA